MNKYGLVLLLLSTTANAELRTWQLSGVVQNVSTAALPWPVSVGDEYVLSFTFDDETSLYLQGSECATYIDPIKAMAIRVAETMVAKPINGSLIVVCDDSVVDRDSIVISVAGPFDVNIDLSSVGTHSGAIKSTAMPKSPPKGLPVRDFGLTAFEGGVVSFFTATIKKVTDRNL
jgi:hypothetical protein